MKINRAAAPTHNSLPRTPPLYAAIGLALATAGLSACAPAPQPLPAPAPRPVPRPAPAPLPAAPAPADWRDLPQAPGTWSYDGAGTARFGQPGLAPALVLRCDRARLQVVLERPGAATQPVPAAITTSSTQRAVSAAPVSPTTLAIALPARDTLLDAMAFSRGRFVVEVNGLPTLVVPAWAEVGRVIEDCR